MHKLMYKVFAVIMFIMIVVSIATPTEVTPKKVQLIHI